MELHLECELITPVPLRATGVWHGPVTGLVGPSGAGKSALLQALAGLLPCRGSLLDDRGRRLDRLPPHRRALAWVPQVPALLPHRTVAQQLAWALAPGEDARRWADTFRDAAGLEGLEDRHPHQLSGGQRQRVQVLLALASDPRVLAVDEGLSQVERPLRRELLALLTEWAREDRLLVLTSHDATDLLDFTRELVVLEPGSREVPPPRPTAEALTAPPGWGTARLLGYQALWPLDVAAGLYAGLHPALLEAASPAAPAAFPARVLATRPGAHGRVQVLEAGLARPDPAGPPGRLTLTLAGNPDPGSIVWVRAAGAPVFAFPGGRRQGVWQEAAVRGGVLRG
ncbi:protein of unknown function [Candidatus Hydrogenisulfobacillus filiaventi]|uniref:ABC transporter domain-containing protein n=1 Tax=Candidatus Hydrogenisulfobacillus filiaventi TaxID=2707344 RepID=A0A6F8ZHS2_9FIRM|nr:ATP-binding cassette domain-containing protein [Bacillota bacterium]CAB1129148.1 protein of unknown function [Candidatus Hydrogenisulfobacillus filiaventi]